jgi:hypothetical protein
MVGVMRPDLASATLVVRVRIESNSELHMASDVGRVLATAPLPGKVALRTAFAGRGSAPSQGRCQWAPRGVILHSVIPGDPAVSQPRKN